MSFDSAAEKVKTFPHKPGVYLMKNAAGAVIYIGKAKILRSRASSYFHKDALVDTRINGWMPEVSDIDCIETESEVDAILMESRLIKDIQPKYNKDLKDSKVFPYLQIRTREPYPRVEITRQPKEYGVKLFGPFTHSSGLNGAVQILQKVFRFRSCSLNIHLNEERWRWFRPCILHSIHQCSGPCNYRITPEEYRKNIKRLFSFLEGKKKLLIEQMKREMTEAAKEHQYEEAAVLRDRIHDLETLGRRGNTDTDMQPEAFVIDPRRGVIGLQKVFKLETIPRIIEGIDIAHLGGTDMVASLVHFIDGLPFKQNYRRYKIKNVSGVDDYACMAEVITRRFSHTESTNPLPDILLIDGGKGQLHAVLSALERTSQKPGFVVSLAKREEEIYIPNQEEPLKLSKHSFSLRLLQYVRDEAHRFAQHYHHILRKNRFS
jgi:excinuclease ABC subunit C